MGGGALTRNLKINDVAIDYTEKTGFYWEITDENLYTISDTTTTDEECKNECTLDHSCMAIIITNNHRCLLLQVDPLSQNTGSGNIISYKCYIKIINTVDESSSPDSNAGEITMTTMTEEVGYCVRLTDKAFDMNLVNDYSITTSAGC